MAGYQRQTSFANGDIADADLLNAEYDALQIAFNNQSGHSHDGTSGEGPVIGLLGDAGSLNPSNRLLVNTPESSIDVYSDSTGSSTQTMSFTIDGLVPSVNDEYDLGSSGFSWQSVYTNNLIVNGEDVTGKVTAIDEVFTGAEKSKLASIESGADVSPTASEIKTLYESNSDTNEFSDAEKSKLAGVEAGAEVNPNASEIKTLYESNPNTNAFTDSYKDIIDNSEAYEPGDVNITGGTITGISNAAFDAFDNGITWSGVVAGSYYKAVNAYHDGTDWLRFDVARPSWLFQYNLDENMVFESYKAKNLWRAQPGANPISGFATTDGWLLADSMSEFGDFTVGGNGVEVDGNGTFPYARLVHSTTGGAKWSGILTNVHLDQSGRDDPDDWSAFSGFIQVDSNAPDYQIAFADGTDPLNWSIGFTVRANGDVYTTGGLYLNGTGPVNAVADVFDMFLGSELSITTPSVLHAANQPIATSGSGSWEIDAGFGRVFERTLTGNTVLESMADPIPGASGMIYVIQDSTGGRTLELASGSTWEVLNGNLNIDESPNAINVFAYYVRNLGAVTLSYLGVIE